MRFPTYANSRARDVVRNVHKNMSAGTGERFVPSAGTSLRVHERLQCARKRRLQCWALIGLLLVICYYWRGYGAETARIERASFDPRAFDALADHAKNPNPLERRPGLLYERFGNTDLTRSFGTRYAPDLDAMDNVNNDYALRFTGFLATPIDGEYAFRVEADTGVRLILGGKTVIDGWAPDGDRAGKASLTKDRPTSFKVEYFFDNRNGGKKAALRLFWTPPGGGETPVPASAYSHTPPPPPRPPAPEVMAAALIKIQGDEQARLDLKLPDGGLKPAVGIHNIQVFRSTRSRPDLADGEGWTFAHHQDLACWKGRLYAAWERAPIFEENSDTRICYATSTDGFHWSASADLFPRQSAWPLRFYFYRASNGRMLAFCSGKTGDKAVVETEKSILLVREIDTNHRLGEVFTLLNLQSRSGLPPSFETAQDAGFVAACREAAGNNLLLEQQDYGIYLGERRMKWHGDPSLTVQNWCQFGKAFCFYHRTDNGIVGLCKMGFATLSEDGGGPGPSRPSRRRSSPVRPRFWVSARRTAGSPWSTPPTPRCAIPWCWSTATTDANSATCASFTANSPAAATTANTRTRVRHTCAGCPSGPTTVPSPTARRCGWSTA
jgi:hypothetical protein